MIEFVVGEISSLSYLQLGHENPWWPGSRGAYCSPVVSSKVTNLVRTSPIRRILFFLYTWSTDCSAPLVQIVDHDTSSPGSYFTYRILWHITLGAQPSACCMNLPQFANQYHPHIVVLIRADSKQILESSRSQSLQFVIRSVTDLSRSR